MYPNLSTILFLDIETVPCTEKFNLLPDRIKTLWEKKHKTTFGNTAAYFPDQSFEDKGGIYAEFGKVVVVGIGFCFLKDGEWHLKTKSIFGHDEKILLEEVIEIMTKWEAKQSLVLCAHNGKEFDFPFLARRMTIHRLKLPKCLDIGNKKPWEIPHLDTMEMWKFGDKKSYTSLELLAAIFDIEGSKDDIDGSQVAQVYYKENNLERIAKYCEKDVVVLIQIYLAMNALDTIKEQNIINSIS